MHLPFISDGLKVAIIVYLLFQLKTSRLFWTRHIDILMLISKISIKLDTYKLTSIF